MNYKVLKDIEYGQHERQKYDLYLPNNSGEKTPLIVWFHGGGFFEGNKETGLKDIHKETMLLEGFAVANSNYRLSRHAPYPAAMLDGVRVVQHLIYNAEKYGINPEKIFLSGYSAGAMIALWIAFNKNIPETDRNDDISKIIPKIKAVGALNAQTILEPNIIKDLIAWKDPLLLEFFQLNKENWLTSIANRVYKDSSPATHVSTDSPPVYLFYDLEMVPIHKNLDESIKIHHPIFGKYLKDKLDKYNTNSKFHYVGDGSNLTIYNCFNEITKFFKSI